MKISRRQLLGMIPAIPLLSACGESKPQRDPVLPDQTAWIGMDPASGPSQAGFCVFRLDPDGIYRLDDYGWIKLSEAL